MELIHFFFRIGILIWYCGNLIPSVTLIIVTESLSNLLARLASILRRTNEVLGDLVFSDVPGRVAKALIDLGTKFGVKKN